MKQDIIQQLFGTTDMAVVIVGAVFAHFGFLITITAFVFFGVRSKTNGTPRKFDLSYFINRRGPQTLLAWFSMLAALRFCGEFIKMDMSMFTCFIIGLSAYSLFEMWQKLTGNKVQLPHQNNKE